MKWEYKIQTLLVGAGDIVTEVAEGMLNSLGEEGWEAVAWWHSPNEPLNPERHDTIALLKRPISK